MKDEFEKTKEKIFGFRKLSSGWFYNGGLLPDDQTINVSNEINDFFEKEGFDKPGVGIGENGEIQVSAFSRSNYLEFTVFSNELIDFVLETNKEIVIFEEQISLNTAKAKIHFWGNLWVSSDLSKWINTIKRMGGSRVPYLVLQEGMEGSLSSMKNVSSQGGTASVNTSTNSIPATSMRIIPLFIGGSA